MVEITTRQIFGKADAHTHPDIGEYGFTMPSILSAVPAKSQQGEQKVPVIRDRLAFDFDISSSIAKSDNALQEINRVIQARGFKYVEDANKQGHYADAEDNCYFVAKKGESPEPGNTTYSLFRIPSTREIEDFKAKNKGNYKTKATY
ncbi:MAG: hypothetical protein NTX79_07605 [Candidatus Micrarchaeota archaeon]|nr:hypothetical protein [Candidatus Micrarchaeota archaeon]